MNKTIKIILGVIGLILLVVILGASFIQVKGIPTYEVEKIEFESYSSPEILERGQKLTMTLCAGCHRDPQSGNLTGTLMKDAPPEFGTIYSQNITQDKEYGIGSWTDGEIKYLLRTGIGKDGRYMPPYMAKLPLMADEDINAIIAFLKSDHPAVAANAKPDKPCEPSFLTKMLTNIAFKPLPYPENTIPMPDTLNNLELGEYLAHNLECFSCHSADFKTNDYLNPEKSEGYFGGGNKLLDLNGNIIMAGNLTPHSSGIGSWSKEKFIKAVKTSVKEGEDPLRYPMQPYAAFTEKEIGAIYDYLKTIPPIENNVPRSEIQ